MGVAYYHIGANYAKQKEFEKMLDVWVKAFKLKPKVFNWKQKFVLWLWRKIK